MNSVRRLSLLSLLLALVLLAALTARGSAARLNVDAGTLQVFTYPVEIEVPTEPSNLNCVSTGFFSRRLEWQPSPPADGYRIYHDGPFWDDDFELEAEVAAPATTYGRVVGSFFRHRWYVTTVRGPWESGASNVIQVPCRPAIFFPGPCGLDGENHHSQRTVALTWEPAAEAALYGVFRAEQSGGPYEMAGTTESTMYEDDAVAAGVTYYYVVVAVDAAGNESDPSAVAAVADVAPTPTPTATFAPTPMWTPTATLSPEPLGTAQPTATLTSTPTPGSIPTWEPSPTSTVTPESASTLEPTATPIATSSATPTVAATPEAGL